MKILLVKNEIKEKDPILLACSSIGIALRNYLFNKISDENGISFNDMIKNIKEIDRALINKGFHGESFEEIEEIEKEEIEEKIEIPIYFILFIIFLIAYVILFLLHFLKIL